MVVTVGRGIPLPPYAGEAITRAVESSRLALIRPGFAGPPSPPGEGDWQALYAHLEKYRSKNLNAAKHVGFPFSKNRRRGKVHE